MFILGYKKPPNFVPTTPDASPDTSFDYSWDNEEICESDPEEGHSTMTLAAQILKEPRKDKFKFCSLKELNKKAFPSTSSSPLPRPSDDTLVISSDEELEVSMVLLEQKVSQNNN